MLQLKKNQTPYGVDITLSDCAGEIISARISLEQTERFENIINQVQGKPLNFDPQYIEWLFEGNHSSAAVFLFKIVTGYHSFLKKELTRDEILKPAPVPETPREFGECWQLIYRYPDLLNRLKEVKSYSKAWHPFIESWDELTKLYLEAWLPARDPQRLMRFLKLLKEESWEQEGHQIRKNEAGSLVRVRPKQISQVA